MMPAFMIVQVTISDDKAYAAYRDAVVPLIEKFGGKSLRNGKAERLEGDAGGIALFEFPSLEAIQSFWNSNEYVPIKELRRGAAKLDIWAVPA